ncbi:polymorphic toxin-type HINT domain-containing protein [Actinoplanes sp. CA-131856]
MRTIRQSCEKGRQHPEQADAVLRTTVNHPFWNQNSGMWVPAGLLVPGVTLMTADGSKQSVINVRNYIGSENMRDLTVAEIHTYYVIPVLVHNVGGMDGCSDAAYQGVLHIREEAAKEVATKSARNHQFEMSDDALADYLDGFAGRGDGIPLVDCGVGSYDEALGVRVVQRNAYSMTAYKQTAAQFASRRAK